MYISHNSQGLQDIKKTYSKEQDAAQTCEIETKIATTKQVALPETKFITMKSLWLELITIRILRVYYKLQKLVERGRVFQFLPEPNDAHNKVRVQILGKEFCLP